MTTLILGGYGNVGRMIVEHLISLTDQPIIIAGRRRPAAQQTADALGSQAQAIQLDPTQEPDYDTILTNVRLAIVCFDLPDDRFAHACLGRGVDLIDISAERDALARVEALDALAQQNQATALLSVGLIPGLSNLMVKHGTAQVPDAIRADNAVLLGMGEDFGAASTNWTLGHLGDHHPENRRRVDFRGEFGVRTTYRLNFADQFTLPQTLPLDKAASWICLDSRFTTHLVGVARALHLDRVINHPTIKPRVVSAMQQNAGGSDAFVLTTQLTNANGQLRYQAWLRGHEEANITALVAAHTARYLLHESVPAGVHHIEQHLDLEDYLPTLTDIGVQFDTQKMGQQCIYNQ